MHINFIHNHINYRKYKKKKFDINKYVIKFIKNKLHTKSTNIIYEIIKPIKKEFYDRLYECNNFYEEQGIVIFYTNNKKYIKIIKKYQDIFEVNGYNIEIKNDNN